MMKIDIEGIELCYKNVSELNVKLQTVLGDVRSKKKDVAQKLKSLNRQERLLRKFLGVQVNDQRNQAIAPNG